MGTFLDLLLKLYNAVDTSRIEWFTFVPTWVIQDFVVLLLGVVVIGLILKTEKRPAPILLEMFCFIFLYAAVYENFATVMGWYGYGQTLVMVFNVPLSIPLIEALFVYASLRFLGYIKIPKWAQVVFTGIFGVLADLTLDPLALAQVHGGIGRWSWFISPGDVNFFGSPVYNYSGWFLLCGYAAAFILIGRHWFEKSGYKTKVGLLYPPLCLLTALLVMVSPLSALLLWLSPWFTKGGWTEYLMFGLTFSAFAAALIIWRGRLRENFNLSETVVFPVVFGTFYLSNLIFDCIAGRFDILLFSLPFIAIHTGIYLWTVVNSRKQVLQ